MFVLVFTTQAGWVSFIKLCRFNINRAGEDGNREWLRMVKIEWCHFWGWLKFFFAVGEKAWRCKIYLSSRNLFHAYQQVALWLNEPSSLAVSFILSASIDQHVAYIIIHKQLILHVVPAWLGCLAMSAKCFVYKCHHRNHYFSNKKPLKPSKWNIHVENFVLIRLQKHIKI